MTSKSGWLTGTIDARPTLLRLDPTSGETVARQELPFADDTIVEVAATDDAVWVVGSASAATGKPALIRLDPTSLEPDQEVPLAIQTPDDVAIVGAEVLITSFTVADKDLIDGVLSNYNPFSQSFKTIRLEDPANSISVGSTDTWLGSWTSLESTGAASKLDATRTGIEKRIEIAEPVQGAATDEAGGVWLTTSRLGPSILADPSEARFRLIHLDSDGAKDQELELKGGRASIELVGDQAWIVVTTFHSAEEAIAESTSYRLLVANVA